MYIFLFTFLCLALTFFFLYQINEYKNGPNSLLMYGLLSTISFIGFIVLSSIVISGKS